LEREYCHRVVKERRWLLGGGRKKGGEGYKTQGHTFEDPGKTMSLGIIGEGKIRLVRGFESEGEM